MQHSIYTYIKEHKLIKPGDTIIIGLSGGPDSVFLLHTLHELASLLQCTLVAAHLNHGWRATAGQDELYCKELCTTKSIPLFVEHAATFAPQIKDRGSQEDAGRQMRRLFFEQLAHRINAQAIALGHHADDQEETFFIRLLRGSSLTGLCGIKPHDGHYIRPLLSCRKAELIAYLHEHKIAYCVDETNDSADYLRNRIRQQIIPALESTDTRFHTTFSATLKQLHAAEQVLADLSKSYLKSLCSQGLLNHQALSTLPDYLQDRILLEWFIIQKVPLSPSAALLKEVRRFLQTSHARNHQVHNEWKLERLQSAVRIVPVDPATKATP